MITIVNMSVFMLRIPCCDIIYGFKTLYIFSSIKNALNIINLQNIKPKKLIHNSLTEELISTYLIEDKIYSIEDKKNHYPCYMASVFNIKEYKMDKNVRGLILIDDTYIRISIRDKFYTFKDNEMYDTHEEIYYTYNNININKNNICTVKFLQRNKTINLIFDTELDLFVRY
jgi:hypothetical protein